MTTKKKLIEKIIKIAPWYDKKELEQYTKKELNQLYKNLKQKYGEEAKTAITYDNFDEYIHKEYIFDYFKHFNVQFFDKNTTFTIILPENIDKTIKYIDKKVETEFSILLSGTINIKQKQVIVNDYYIPEQEVTTASFQIKENIDLKKWNGILHKHPTGCTNFSSTDWEYIHKNHKFSILLESSEYRKAFVFIDLIEKDSKAEVRICFEATIKIKQEENEELNKIIQEKIKRKRYYGYFSSYTDYYYNQLSKYNYYDEYKI